MSAEIIHGDCLEVMRGMESESIDAIVTDPPYNVGLKYAGDETRDTKTDYRDWCESWFREAERISRGPIAISCGVPNIGMWFGIKQPTWVISWWKPAAMGRCVVGFNNWEPVVLWRSPRGRKGADVVRAPILIREDTGGHPCPKPVEWAAGLLRLLTKPNDLVLDPFTGSGTTGIAAIQEGRRFVGIEKEAQYVEIARRRIAEVQPALGVA